MVGSKSTPQIAPDHEMHFYNRSSFWPYNSININKLPANTFLDSSSTTDTWSSIGSLVMSSFVVFWTISELARTRHDAHRGLCALRQRC